MKRLLYALLLVLPSLGIGHAQYAGSGSGSTVAAAEINGKINHQEASGLPTSVNCTQAKDLYTDTATGSLYVCTTSGTPGTWARVLMVIASGTATMGTSAIAANTCATVVNPSASVGSLTGLATTDLVSYTPNADLSAVTGYGTGASDGLIIFPYVTTNNVNFKVCNATGTSITPGAATLNWRVMR